MTTNLLKRLAGAFRRGKTTDFVSFWHGPIDGFTYGCLASFPYHGARFRLYCYDKIHVPPGIDLADAREICPDMTLVNRYIADGKVAFSKFSNLFRYLLIEKTGYCWVDCDLICLRKPEFHNGEMVFGYQLPKGNPQAINGAILKLPREHPVLAELIQHAREVADLNQSWGAIGPKLLTPKLYAAGLSEFASAIDDFYPVSYSNFWKLLLPEERESVETAVHPSKLLHIWHHMFEIAGYDKNLAPPRDSYLHSALKCVGGLDQFNGIYDAAELRKQLSEWVPSVTQRND